MPTVWLVTRIGAVEADVNGAIKALHAARHDLGSLTKVTDGDVSVPDGYVDEAIQGLYAIEKTLAKAVKAAAALIDTSPEESEVPTREAP